MFILKPVLLEIEMRRSYNCEHSKTIHRNRYDGTKK